MAWIKFEHETLDKQEMSQIAALLDIDIDSAVGKCLRLWVWADQQSVDGDALSVTQAFIDRITFQPGFAKALLSVGWLDGRDGRYSIPNFDRHNGETAKKRAQTAKRMAAKRNKCDAKSDATSVTNGAPRERERERNIHTPTQEEVIEYFESKNYHEMMCPKKFHALWESRMWLDKGAAFNWKAKADLNAMSPTESMMPEHKRSKNRRNGKQSEQRSAYKELS